MALFDIVMRDGVLHIVVSTQDEATIPLREFVEKTHVIKVAGVPYSIKEARELGLNIDPSKLDAIVDEQIERELRDWEDRNNVRRK